MKSMKKTIAILVAVSLLVGCALGGTLAWLTASTTQVTNTFTDSDVKLTLTETGATLNTAGTKLEKDYQMVPGWTLDKNPTVTVDPKSEDCWVFVKITESTTPDLDAYIKYAIASGWETIQAENANGETVIARRVYKTDSNKEFSILAAGTYKDASDVTYTWGDNEVLVLPEVTKTMMENIKTTRPTLTFDACAVQLYKANNGGENGNEKVEFTAAEAWAKVKP